MRALAALAVFVLAGCAYSPPPTPVTASATSGFVVTGAAGPEWRSVDAETGTIKDLAGLQSLAAAFPESSSVHLRLLRAHFGAENASGVMKEALWLARRGYSFSDGARERIIAMGGETAVTAGLEKLLSANGKPIESSQVIKTFPASAQLIESVVLDPTDAQIYASTVVSRNVITELKSGTQLKLEPEGVGSLSGMAIDARDGFLWVASGDLGMSPKDATLFRGLLRFEKADKSKPVRFAAPDGVNLSDITVAPDGTVFASSPMGGGIYRLRDDTIETFIAPGTFRSPQGLAVSADQTKLYVSDYRYGLAVVDLATKRVSRLAAQSPMVLDGIDGLWRHGDRLIAVQNGMSPMRIVSIELSADGMSAATLDVLERAHSGWTEPLGGAIHDGALYYVATGQWDRFEDGGVPKEGVPPVPTDIRRLPL